MLELKNLSKRFGNTQALSDLSLTAERGAIVGIAGPNGAGKSTLSHILAGEIVEDTGAVLLDGRELSVEQRPASVAIVHQEVRLFPNLTVLDNLLVGAAHVGYRRPSADRAILDVAREFGLDRYLREEVGRCSIVIQQLTEIARAMVQRKDIILLDEPNSALTIEESRQLFDEVRRVRDSSGAIVLLVSHRLGDLEKYCDSVAVVRDGRVIETLEGDRLTSGEIAAGVAGGRTVLVEAAVTREEMSRETPSSAGSVLAVIELRGWTDGWAKAFADIDLTVEKGDILFFTGQEDGGGRELLQSLAGLRPSRGAAATLPDHRRGETQFLPGKRASSLFPNFSVRSNLNIRVASRRDHPCGVLRPSALKAVAARYVGRLAIKTPSDMAAITQLSGGTQQKVALGSALAAAPKLLVVEEPTRGVDVQTRREIVEILREFARSGGTVVGFSPELEEVYELATTVRVARGGGISDPWPDEGDRSVTGLARWVDAEISAHTARENEAEI